MISFLCYPLLHKNLIGVAHIRPHYVVIHASPSTDEDGSSNNGVSDSDNDNGKDGSCTDEDNNNDGIIFL